MLWYLEYLAKRSRNNKGNIMTREEARKEYYGTNIHGMTLIDKIYDSIGSCKECTEFDTDDCFKIWSISSSRIKRENWYCADFERQTDDS